MRIVVIVTAVVAAGAATEVRVRAAHARWGGPPVAAWVAVEGAGVGETPQLRRVRLPPRALPSAFLRGEPPGTPLTMALPAGAVLTEAHVAPAGPAVGIAPDARLVPVPVDEGWSVTAGGAVDVWVRDDTGGSATLVATRQAVMDVRVDESGDLTALVVIGADEVPAVASGLARGAVWLSHVPSGVP